MKKFSIVLLVIFVWYLISGQAFAFSGWFFDQWPDTGQTNCYNESHEMFLCPEPGEPFNGQDAQFQGPINSYTKLAEGGIELPDTATQTDGWIMTRDNITGLIWEIKTDDNGIHDKDNAYTWCDTNPATNGGDEGTCGATDTEDFITALNDANFGGFSDWRLPDINALSTLFNMSFDSRKINKDFFPNTAYSYWSSTTYINDPQFAWYAMFSSGDIFKTSKDGSTNYVRAVRGGQYTNEDSVFFEDLGNGIVLDNKNNLMWQKFDEATPMTWEEAFIYIENLNTQKFAGYSDWRLPNKNELQSIVDYTRYNPALIKFFSLAQSGRSSDYSWSSTSIDRVGSPHMSAYCLDNKTGDITTCYKGHTFYVRAVRSTTSDCDADCDDGLYCNGAETCDGAGRCQPGTPVDCNDGVGCTDDSCDEVNDTCVNAANDANCPDDGQFCTGVEYCDTVTDCDTTGNPCQAGETCNEGTETCDQAVCGNGTVDAGEACDEGVANGTTTCGCQSDCTYASAGTSCADGAFCNGDETCDGAGACQSGTPVTCDDGVGCTEDICNEVDDACLNIADNTNCPDDGSFCNGTEFCDEANDCSSSGDPCQAGETCNEGTDTCDALTCAVIPDKGTCAADPNCQWVGKGKNGSCQDIPPAEDCTDGIDNDGDGLADCDDSDCAGIGSCPPLPCAGLDRVACQNDPTCEWSGKNKVCSDAAAANAAANCSDYNGDAKACSANGCSYDRKTDTCS